MLPSLSTWTERRRVGLYATGFAFAAFDAVIDVLEDLASTYGRVLLFPFYSSMVVEDITWKTFILFARLVKQKGNKKWEKGKSVQRQVKICCWNCFRIEKKAGLRFDSLYYAYYRGGDKSCYEEPLKLLCKF